MADIDVSEYYGHAARLEEVRDLLKEAEKICDIRHRNHAALRGCLDSHDWDDTLASLSVANSLGTGDRLTETAEKLLSRHDSRSKMQGISDFVFTRLPKGNPVREQLCGILRKAATLSFGKRIE